MSYYFDHNSSTPADERVLECFREIERDYPGNPGSLHATGRRARGVVEDSRDRLAQLFGVDRDHVFFVSGGTEANNLAVLGSGDTTQPVLCAPVEHPSVLRAAEQRGTVEWGVDETGRAVVTEPEREVGMIALVHGQNEVGTLQPVEEAAELAMALGVPIHVDLSQTLGRHPVLAVTARVDSVTLSPHKSAGLKGLGVLLDKTGGPRPLFFGGGQQQERRPGTESAALAAAATLAIELAVEEQEQRSRAMRAARDAFEAQVQFEGCGRLTPDHSLPNTVMYFFADVDGRQLLPALDMAGVEASQGSACSSGSPTPPRVLTAMGLDSNTIRSCVRFSFSHHTSLDDAADGGRIVKRVVLGMRAR